ncbi:MAG: rRNA pseudouridine synthase [Firmicutes bacterium]|nr:rRNA pseudouridine synthase [Bacillota bacterium]
MEERLQKVMAQAGVASRRGSEDLIKENRVMVNGQLAVLGQKVDPARDRILVDGKPIQKEEAKRYFILNKPFGYITTSKDQFGRKSVLDLLDGVKERVYPAGRLDYDSEGLVLLTNDGDLAYRVTHPSFKLPKRYVVQVKGKITMDAVYRLRTGVILEEGRTQAAQVEVLQPVEDNSVLSITITEGRNRQVRRMCAKVGFEVVRLQRTGIGPVNLGKLASGQFRPLSKKELQSLLKAVKL